MLLAWPACADKLKITFVVPDGKGPLFWNLVADIAQAAADDLEVELETLYSDSHRFGSKLAIEAIIKRDIKPDFVIFRPFHGNAIEVFDLLEKNQIPFVTLEQAFVGKEAEAIGSPQQTYSHWLGQINYDNRAGGQLLTEALLKHHTRRMPQKIMRITGIGGDFDAISKSRQAYLEAPMAHTEQVLVNQIFPMYWSPAMVQQRFADIHNRYPNTTAYWCAGDQMALEVIKQLKLLTGPVAEDILIGGFDWLPQALEKIHRGEMTASVGGHFLMAAAAVVRIVDYHQGLNYFLANSTTERLELIDSDNIAVYFPFLDKAPWPEIDYRQFSATKNSQGKAKAMTVGNLLEAYSQISLQGLSHH